MLRASDRLPAPRLELEALEDRVVPAGLVGDLVIFGDSLSDTGNISARSGGFIPGSLYFDGRYSGGAVWVDTLAEYLGEGPVTPTEEGGLNYAYGGSTLFIPTAANPYKDLGASTLNDQITNYLGDDTPSSNDLFVLWGGANDFFYASNASLQTLVATVLANFPPDTPDKVAAIQAAQDLFEATIESPQFLGLAALAADAMGAAVERLDCRGGDRFVVANLPPLGQTPFFQDLLEIGFIDQGIVDAVNGWSATFNAMLQARLAGIDDADTYVLQIDVDAIFDTLTGPGNPAGLTDLDDAVGPYNAAGFLTAITATDPDGHLFYDSVHPGTRAQQYIGLQAAADVLESLGASTVWVKTTADAVDPLDGKVSLREAVNLTNATYGEQTILFSLGNGAKTITLGSQLSLTDHTNIVGTGTNKLTISGDNATRIFHVAAGADVDLAAMTLRNGRAEQGGAIYNAGDLTVIDVVFQNNTATGANARGGAIYNTGDLDVFLSAFVGNKAIGTGAGNTAFGGAIATEGASASTSVYLSSLTANEARGRDARGGAIYAGAESSLSLAGSILHGNRAHATSGGTGYGGGVYLANDVCFALLLSSLSGNSASTAGANLFAE